MQPSPHWKQLYSGRAFDVLDPTLESISIIDIAHSLALTNRYGGHTAAPYSVAQHSVLVSQVVATVLDGGPVGARYGLLHDAAEAYLGDLVRPLKYLPEMRGYRNAERKVQAVIFERFGLAPEMPRLVKLADDCLLTTEAASFFPVERRPFAWAAAGMVLDTVDVTPWDWRKARASFLDRFAMLWPEETIVNPAERAA